MPVDIDAVYTTAGAVLNLAKFIHAFFVQGMFEEKQEASAKGLHGPCEGHVPQDDVSNRQSRHLVVGKCQMTVPLVKPYT